MPSIDEMAISYLDQVIERCWLHASKLEFKAGDAEPISGRLLFITIQHCHAATILLEKTADSSAAALIRAAAECGGRSLYALLCADETEIAKFKNDNGFPFGGYVTLVKKLRAVLHKRPELGLSPETTDNLFLTTVERYELFCSYAHGGWQPVSWTLSDNDGYMVSSFPESIRCLSAMIIAETCVQTMLVQLAVAGLADEANDIVRLHSSLFTVSLQEQMTDSHETWLRAQASLPV